MNSIIILANECEEPGLAVMRGERALHFHQYHDLQPGAKTNLAIFGEFRGSGEILEVSQDQVKIRFDCKEPALKQLPLEILVAVPRPQSVKKILNTAAMFGIKAVHFFPGELGQKSYMQSKSLSPEEIQKQLILGLEQVFDSRAPHVTISNSLNDALENISCESSLKLLCTTNQSKPLQETKEQIVKDNNLVIAIGPEAGWKDWEEEKLKKIGYVPVSLGERALRVDVAVNAVLGVVQFLKG